MMRTLSAQQMAGWKTKENSSSAMKSERWRNAGPSAFQMQETTLKSEKIWCAHLVVHCVRLRTFWTPLVHRLEHTWKILLTSDAPPADICVLYVCGVCAEISWTSLPTAPHLQYMKPGFAQQEPSNYAVQMNNGHKQTKIIHIRDKSKNKRINCTKLCKQLTYAAATTATI